MVSASSMALAAIELVDLEECEHARKLNCILQRLNVPQHAAPGHGNKVINSIATSLYWDMNPLEPLLVALCDDR